MGISQILRILCYLIATIFAFVKFWLSKHDTIEAQYISDCKCSKRWFYPPLPLNKTGRRGSYLRLSSSCSDTGTRYQPNQNVISFVLYYKPNSTTIDPKNPYKSSLNLEKGLLQNLKMVRKHYPGYSVRVYTSVSLQPRGYFCNLLCNNKDLFWCDITRTPSDGDLSRMYPLTWRFLPLGDPTVNIFHSRDLDSLVSERDSAAVRDWQSNSSKPFMGMRDQQEWHDFPILGGMWGADNTKLGRTQESLNLRHQMISISQWTNSNVVNFDQQFLNDYLFYPRGEDMVFYDSYYCTKWSNFTEVRPFPIQRDNFTMDFVGNRVNFLGNQTKYQVKAKECPVECRPSYGQDWIYC